MHIFQVVWKRAEHWIWNNKKFPESHWQDSTFCHQIFLDSSLSLKAKQLAYKSNGFKTCCISHLKAQSNSSTAFLHSWTLLLDFWFILSHRFISFFFIQGHFTERRPLFSRNSLIRFAQLNAFSLTGSYDMVRKVMHIKTYANIPKLISYELREAATVLRHSLSY